MDASSHKQDSELFQPESDARSVRDTPLVKALIRPCERYEDEYAECKSFKSRRLQVFVHGEVLDCESWAEDIKNCKKWEWNGDEEAGSAIIENEKKRLRERLVPHFQNKVWNKRDGPPADWNKPLPEFEELNKNSYFNVVAREGSETISKCTIQ